MQTAYGFSRSHVFASCCAMRCVHVCRALSRCASSQRAIADGNRCRVHGPLSGAGVFLCCVGVIQLQCMSIHDCTVPTSPHPVARRAANGEEAQGEEGEEGEGPEEEVVRPN